MMTSYFEQFLYLARMNKDIFTKRLGKQVAKIRKERGLTQAELGKLLKKSKQDIHRLEIGAVTPNSYFVYLIAKALKVSGGDLIDL